MTRELLSKLPPREKLLAEIAEYEPEDEFGQRIVALYREAIRLEELGEIAVWPARLLLYELARRKAELELVKKAPGYYRRLITPGESMSWDKMMEFIQGKEVRFENGGYRAIPTPAHVKHLTRGFHYVWGDEINVVAFESVANLSTYKRPGAIVFPGDLRAELLRHLPAVDVVTIVPDFDGLDPELFWKEKYTKLKDNARTFTLLTDRTSFVQRSQLVGFDHVNFMDAWWPGVDFEDKSEHLYWDTSDWDKISRGEKLFVSLAKKYLLKT